MVDLIERLARKWCPYDEPHVLCACLRIRGALHEALEEAEIWVIEEGVEGEGVYTLAICKSEKAALAGLVLR